MDGAIPPNRSGDRQGALAPCYRRRYLYRTAGFVHMW